jgi:hypothetical protein
MIDWIALAFTLIGTYLYSVGTIRELEAGFVVLTIGNVLWLLWALQNHITSMVVSSILFGILNVKAYYKWKGEKK